jgi:hypothetical protein
MRRGLYAVLFLLTARRGSARGLALDSLDAERAGASSVLTESARAGTTRALSAGLLVATLSVMPAAADHCPPGQFYRVRLNQCVGLNTRLASAYVHVGAARLATPGRAERVAPRAEPGAGPVGQPEAPFVLPTLDWPAPK